MFSAAVSVASFNPVPVPGQTSRQPTDSSPFAVGRVWLRGVVLLALFLLGPAVAAPPARAADIDHGSITPGGSSVTVRTGGANDTASVQFDGVAGRRVALLVGEVSWTGGDAMMSKFTVTIKKPDGSTLKSGSDNYPYSYGWLDTTAPLPVGGPYKIVFDPNGTLYGSARLTLYDVPPDPQYETFAGQPNPALPNFTSGVTLTTAKPGQNASVQFDGRFGQRISVAIDPVSWQGGGSGGGFAATFTIRGPGLWAGWPRAHSLHYTNSRDFIEPFTLPTDGRYTIEFNPHETRYGSARLLVYDLPPDPSQLLPPESSQTIAETYVPGQSASVGFDGIQGQQVSLVADQASWSGGFQTGAFTANFSIKSPTGAELKSANLHYAFASTSIPAFSLPVDGRYTIVFNPVQSRYGRVRLTLSGRDLSGLLQKHAPVLKTDADDDYNADSPGIMADSGNTIMRFFDGTVSDLAPGLAELGSSYLTISDDPAQPEDYLDVFPDGADSMRSIYGNMRDGHPGFHNRAYGRMTHDHDGRLVLQYWLFYFYQDSILNFGEHEGDWEMVQVRLDRNNRPDLASYSQHGAGQFCRWDRVRHEVYPDSPDVYVAQTTHANYFTDGRHGTYEQDIADGDDTWLIPPVARIPASDHRWVAWPGHWGGTGEGEGEGSPAGPGHGGSNAEMWNNPGGWATSDACAG